MRELNRLAYENALQNRLVLSDEADPLSINEKSIIDEIIRLSKEDGLSPLRREEGDDEEEKQEEEKENEEVIFNSKKRKLEGTSNLPEQPLTSTMKRLGKEEELPSVTTSNVTPTSSPVKQENIESPDTTPLRRSARKRSSVLERLESVSNESSPRSSRRQSANLHSKFNTINDIIPKHHRNIKLMEPPQIDTNDDELLILDSMSKQRNLYHDGYEAYFEQTQTRGRISKSSMTKAPELSYEEFNRYNKFLDFICTEPINSLNKLYEFQFSQWLFELREGFNLVFYGIGSKRRLLFNFVQDFLLPLAPQSKCIVINGYNTEFNLRMLMREIWRVCFHKSLPTARETREACNFTHLEFMKSRNRNKRLYILLHNIDGESLRNDDLQYMLSQLVIIRQVSMICSVDNLNMPLFWDASVISNFNFIWHNTSTFHSYSTEVSFKDPLSIGRTDELLGSRGARYVLSSLTGNAKSLYKNLILQQLEKVDAYIGNDTKLLDNRGNIKGSLKTCFFLRDFYELCVTEFIISNDISFRTILGEFVEHKMCNLTRDTSGTEVLYISFTINEMEKLLDEELMD
ncbi:hypothetical protein PMKS-003144 [Pichia membranifaciens]|uniref:Origin recognition complex subunit 2 n=1 Tax=Pichia membranifaciens TaxID=4926 RepID=A0A1Q2YJU3_9ASCO|nr:hypothetical protein PMKS-003144 [Pichia membranifaciens]